MDQDLEMLKATDAILDEKYKSKKGTDDHKIEEWNRTMEVMDVLGLRPIQQDQYLLGMLEHTFTVVRRLTNKGNVRIQIKKGMFHSNKKTIEVAQPVEKEGDKPVMEKFVMEGQDYNTKITITNIDVPIKYFRLLGPILGSASYWVDAEKGLVATNPKTKATLIVSAQYAGTVMEDKDIEQGRLSFIAALDEHQLAVSQKAYGTWHTYLDCKTKFEELLMDYILNSLGDEGSL